MAALARHVFAIGLSGPMSSSERKSERVDCRVALSKSIPQEMEREGRREKQESGRGERGSESGADGDRASGQEKLRLTVTLARFSDDGGCESRSSSYIDVYKLLLDDGSIASKNLPSS